MQKNSGDFSMENAMRFVNSPAGQKLLALLQQSNDAGLRTAMEQAAKGDMDQAKESLRTIAASAEIKKLLEQMGGT